MTGTQATYERIQSAAFVALVAVSTLISLRVAPPLEGQFGAWLAVVAIAIAIADYRAYIIPNALAAAAAMLGLLRAGLLDPEPAPLAMFWALARAIVAAAPFWLLMVGYRHWRGRDGLGFGDVKLAAVAGLWLDWMTIFIVVEVAALSAIAAYGLSSFAKQRPLRKTALVPFGVFLAPAIWIGWLAEVWWFGMR